MKFTFLCGSLEPGCDGVGDYTRKLAEELTRHGHKACAIALYDKSVENIVAGNLNSPSDELPTLRIPYALANKVRFIQAKEWIDEFDPDIISLQFVIFSFNQKGLPFSLARYLRHITGNKRWHIMFHEIWVGISLNDTFKRRIWGIVQKRIITNLLRKLKPRIVHTQCDLFYNNLSKLYRVQILPLFSNIEIAKETPERKYRCSETKEEFRLAFFGGLHAQSKLKQLVAACKHQQDNHHRSFKFIYIGNSGSELSEHTRVLASTNISYEVLGRLTSEQVSNELAKCSFGVSTSSPQMLQKNGTVAAMILHDLPVLSIGREIELKNKDQINLPPGTYRLDSFNQIISQDVASGTPIFVHDVVEKFLTDINSVS